MAEEPVAGKPLEEALVPGQPHPWRDALSVAIQVGRGLQKLHESGLVHRGVRPDRILVLDSGTCRLTDPAPARPESPASPAAVDGVSNGTALYMSPEQAVGERVDLRTDVFALGALTYRLLTGHDAFEADGARRILARVLHDRPPPPSRWVADLPPGVDGVLARALAKPWKDRYADVGSFCDDLGDLLAGRAPRNASVAPASPETWPFLPVSATPGVGEATGTLSRRLGRRPIVRALFGLLAMALVLGLEVVRRSLEAPGTPPAGLPTSDTPMRREASSGAGSAADLPSLEPPPTSRLSIDFRHTLESGILVVRVDGATVLESRVTGTVTRRILGIKLREGRLRQVIDVSPGRHSILVRVRWGDDERSDTIAGTFAAGTTRTLRASVGRIGRRLSMDWQ
jgi:serine/threonine protein kinase